MKINVEKRQLMCGHCKTEMIPKETLFHYLNHSFHATVPCCPICGMVYISKELAKGRMSEVEMTLEDK